jgi:methylated-DNA-protein-cysteine methyltransferase-like protein
VKGKAAPPEVPPFERVQRLIRRIPPGRVATYGQLSQLIDERLTPVGIGWAIRAAPEGSLPWHRVVNARGGISTDAHHQGLQRSLLEAEGVAFTSGGCVDLDRHRWAPRKS